MEFIVETWRPVVNYEDRYEVSSLGRVRTLYKGKAGKTLIQRECPNGYQTVVLYREGIKKTRRVSRLVALAFLGLPSDGQIVLHGVNGVSDNSVENLSWGTYRQNSIDKVRDGTMYSGSRHWKNKLAEYQAEKIFDLYLAGLDKRSIAEKLSITHQNVHAILIGKTWKHVYAKKMQVKLSEVYDMWGDGQKAASATSLIHLRNLLGSG